jgi:hypothetical protein
MVGNLHRAESPQCRDLLGVKPGRAIQAGHENDGERLGHWAVLIFRSGLKKSGSNSTYCSAAGLTLEPE